MSCFHGSISHVNNPMSQFLKNTKLKMCVFVTLCYSSKEEEKEPKRRSSYAAAGETMLLHVAPTAIHQQFWSTLPRKWRKTATTQCWSTSNILPWSWKKTAGARTWHSCMSTGLSGGAGQETRRTVTGHSSLLTNSTGESRKKKKRRTRAKYWGALNSPPRSYTKNCSTAAWSITTQRRQIRCSIQNTRAAVKYSTVPTGTWK